MSFSQSCIFKNGKSLTLNTTFTNIGGVGFMTKTLEFRDNNFPSNINSIDDEICNHEIQSKNKIKKLKEAHKRRMQRMNSQYFDMKKMLQDYSFNNEENQIQEKKKKIEELEKMGDNTDIKSVISQRFMENQKKIFNDRFNKKKKKN